MSTQHDHDHLQLLGVVSGARESSSMQPEVRRAFENVHRLLYVVCTLQVVLKFRIIVVSTLNEKSAH